MSTTSLTAAQVLDKVAVLMNDAAKTSYTYVAMLPYLNMAFTELQETFAQNNIPVTNETAPTTFVIPVGTVTVKPIDGIGSGAAPNLPNDIYEIQGLYERLNGSNDPYTQIIKREFLPHSLETQPTEALQYWVWEGQQIRFLPANTVREVKMDYVKSLFPVGLANENTIIGLIAAESFLFYRTASLCAQFIGENETRAETLNGYAIISLDRTLAISTKGKQSIQTRRRPFRASYKRRSYT